MGIKIISWPKAGNADVCTDPADGSAPLTSMTHIQSRLTWPKGLMTLIDRCHMRDVEPNLVMAGSDPIIQLDIVVETET